MNREQAKKLIEKTFESSFDKAKFIVFIKNLLNHIEKSPFIYRGNIIPDAFEQYINTLERIGKYNDGENKIDLLIVKLKRTTSLERARTMQRNFIAWYLKGSRGGIYKNAALVAFVSPDKEDWRFSLVKVDYVFDKSGKVIEEKSPACRRSFLVGKNEKSHTAQSRLVPILEDDGHNPTLKQLEEAFNIEPVTKEFFDKYRALLIRTVDELDKIVGKDENVRNEFNKKNINTVDFAKKLLGQIVFLYFLQKKGWFGVERDAEWGSGPKDFLRGLFKKKYGNYENFFNGILEPLFYEALARERDDDFYSRFNCKIPFLNGGLFDPMGDYNWVHTDIPLPNELFSNNRRTPEGDIGDGILDVFDRFNFTVKEDEPLEKEVAIDPELLGKLYEKFNAIRADNFYEYKKALASSKRNLEKQFNKKFGVYYTPREIVHYMCQQGLINYLSGELEGNVSKDDIEKLIKYGEQFTENEATALIKEQRIKEGKQKTSDYKLKLPESIRKNAKLIDDKLKEVKVCDPAVGSGAFLVGMMHEVVKTRNVLSVFINESGRTNYNFKQECIENSLYGVDIDSGAVEIAKLRLWLSLIVDEEDIRNIKPLPNLDYKIMQGNSLISEFMGLNLDEEKQSTPMFEDEIDHLIKQFQKKKTDLLNEFDRTKKKQLKQEIESLIINIFEEKLRKQKSQYFSQLKSIEKQASRFPNQEEQNKYLKEGKEKIYKETGFNLTQVEKQLKEYTSGRKTRPFFPWRLYFAEVFAGENPGFDIVIANPPYIKEYINRKAFDGLRESPYYKGKMDIWYLFACKGIDLLKRGTGILAFIAQNNWVTSYGASIMRNKVIRDTQIIQMIDFGSYMIFESSDIQTTIMIFRVNSSNDNYKFDYRRLEGTDLNFNDVLGLLNDNKNSKTIYFQPTIQRNKFIDKPLTFNNPVIDLILDKISEQSNFKLAESEIAQGIVPNPDKVNKINIKKIPSEKIKKYNIKVGDGVFIIDQNHFKDLNESEKEYLKPIYEPSQLDRFYISQSTEAYIIYFTKKNFNKKECPNLIKHLEKYKEIMEERRENKQGKIDFYHLHWPRHEEFFTKGAKILSVRKCEKPTFAYTEKNAYVMMAINVIKSNRINLKYLTALLNSELIAFWLKHKGKMQGNNYQIDKEPLLALPLKSIPDNDQNSFITLVDKILAITKDDDYLQNETKQKKVKEYERQIDKMVYKLYGLTQEEIKIVEKQIN